MDFCDLIATTTGSFQNQPAPDQEQSACFKKYTRKRGMACVLQDITNTDQPELVREYKVVA